MDVGDFIENLCPQRNSEWAWEHYKDAVLAATRFFEFRSLLEIGAGRSPLFSSEEIAELGLHYTINDIAPEELDLAPDDVDKRCFDIAGEISESGCYDFAFSQQVFEHLEDGARAYRNLYALLRPGGMALNFHPTLFAPPFVLNRCLPEALALRVLKLVQPDVGCRRRKFPAYYSWCYATSRTEQMIRSAGFTDVHIIPFYGYSYARNIPIIGRIDRAFNNWIAAFDFRPLAAFAYTLARK